jgi:hypothetical protein
MFRVDLPHAGLANMGETRRLVRWSKQEGKGSGVIVRISKGHYRFDEANAVEEILRRSELEIRRAVERLPGLMHFYIGIDRSECTVCKVSVWDNVDHARALRTVEPVRAFRRELNGAGVVHEIVTNHDVQWSLSRT